MGDVVNATAVGEKTPTQEPTRNAVVDGLPSGGFKPREGGFDECEGRQAGGAGCGHG